MVTAFSLRHMALSALPAPHVASPNVFWNLEFEALEFEALDIPWRMRYDASCRY